MPTQTKMTGTRSGCHSLFPQGFLIFVYTYKCKYMYMETSTGLHILRRKTVVTQQATITKNSKAFITKVSP